MHVIQKTSLNKQFWMLHYLIWAALFSMHQNNLAFDVFWDLFGG
jgi:hypothetical protein